MDGDILVDAPDELTTLREKVGKLEEVEKAKNDLEAKVKELENDEQNMNWRKARDKEKRLLAALKADGKEVDDDGNLVEKPKGYTDAELAQKTTEQVEKIMIEKSLARAEKKLSETDRPIFRKAYEKVVHGEDVNSDNVEEFVEQAIMFAGRQGSNSMSDRLSSTRGGAPVFEEAGKSYADTPAGQAAAEKMGLKITSTKK